ncbi:MAG: hypothetical protein ACTSSH_01595, partial [Candidatus Heimdallarchaeota archaeon]
MTRKPEKGTCEHCGLDFDYYLVHSGFNNSGYSYCNTCGKTAILDLTYSKRGIAGFSQRRIQKIAEQLIDDCECGGKFQFEAKPRCPHCLEELSAVEATKYLDKKTADSKVKWRWQQNWSGIYCILI